MGTAAAISTIAIGRIRPRMGARPLPVGEASMAAKPVCPDPANARTIELIRRAQSGDELARNALFDRYRPRLVHWATGRLPYSARDCTDTQDLVQQVLSAVLRAFSAFDPRHDGAFPAWLHRILKGKLIDAIRKAARKPAMAPLSDEEPYTGASPLDVLIDREERRRYEGAVACLPQEDQDLIFLRIELGLTYKEIVDITGKRSPDAVRMELKRIVMRLSRKISDDTV
jgi:RNA polymerase sigma factor (sigma-70 family)